MRFIYDRRSATMTEVTKLTHSLQTADEIQKSIDEFFPNEEQYKIISEPGTFFVASSMVLAAKVVGKRILNGEHPRPRNTSYLCFIVMIESSLGISQ